jgi:hypothetical protein
MRNTFIAIFVLFSLTSIGQATDYSTLIEQNIKGAWIYSHFEIDSTVNENETHLIPEKLGYLEFTSRVLIFQSGGFAVAEYSESKYQIKSTKGGNSIFVKLKNTKLPDHCDVNLQLEVISCGDSVLKIKSCSNPGYSVYNRTLTPDEITQIIQKKLQGQWLYSETTAERYLSNGWTTVQVPNEIDTATTFNINGDSIVVQNAIHSAYNVRSKYTIVYNRYFRTVSVNIAAFETNWLEFPIIYLGDLNDITDERMILINFRNDHERIIYTKIH